ncbi:Glyoxylate/hydroxypyruvate reductase A [Raoultella terrigena]|uniref:Glyoxylate/hydroxypyruvate reductase A n=1 Tax=Raoultella terrigena TaxID=577 RepID=A0A4U9DHK0_RAOTE|nr:Glyoxylate/hydroxypyruvate reductase A [Raoultella terrigena]
MAAGAKLCRADELNEFLRETRVLINPAAQHGGDGRHYYQQLLAQLPDGSYVLNLARGVHVVEDDLLAALGKR